VKLVIAIVKPHKLDEVKEALWVNNSQCNRHAPSMGCPP
jgi:nitrogen regulatory protein PII